MESIVLEHLHDLEWTTLLVGQRTQNTAHETSSPVTILVGAPEASSSAWAPKIESIRGICTALISLADILLLFSLLSLDQSRA